MRRLGRLAGGLGLAVAALGTLIWVYGPRHPVDTGIAFDAGALGNDLDAYFAAREARFDDIVPGAEKRVVWHGEAGARTDLAVVYIHGFSASAEEVRPLPDRVAEALGANLIFTRLTGHGRDGAALAGATAGDWLEDTAEALAAGRAAGDAVVVMATSTGGTLAALAALDPMLGRDLAGVVLISPNFRLANRLAPLLTWPGARWWLPRVAGETRSFVPLNDAHARYWTESYPTVAVLPMAALVAHARSRDWSEARVPALFLFSDADAVVDHRATRAVAGAWGGPATLRPQEVPRGNDPSHHVIAGDILSPGMTGPLAETIVDWVRGLGR